MSTHGWTSKELFEFEQLVTKANAEQLAAAERRVSSERSVRIARKFL